MMIANCNPAKSPTPAEDQHDFHEGSRPYKMITNCNPAKSSPPQMISMIVMRDLGPI